MRVSTNPRKRIRAEEEVTVAPEATDLLFEAEDVAELIAEVTGKEVEVTADEDMVTFSVDGDEFTVEPEGDEEVLEAVRKPFARKRTVASSRKVNRTVKASASVRRPKSALSRRVPGRRTK